MSIAGRMGGALVAPPHAPCSEHLAKRADPTRRPERAQRDEALLNSMGIQGAIGGKPHKTRPCPLDIGAFDTKAPLANRPFLVLAPNMLRDSDDTYLATWKGFAYVAFRVKAYARLSIKGTEQLAEAGIEPAARSARAAVKRRWPLAFTGLFKAEAIHRRRPWRSVKAVE